MAWFRCRRKPRWNFREIFFYVFLVSIFVVHFVVQYTITPLQSRTGSDTLLKMTVLTFTEPISRAEISVTSEKPVNHIEVPNKPLFNCSNIDQIKLKNKLGHGVSKQVYLGHYDGKKYAVKMVTRKAMDITSCLRRFEALGVTDIKHTYLCYAFPNMKLMKEMLILQQLDHPNILLLLGYCVRSDETQSTSLETHGVVGVYEYGEHIHASSTGKWPWMRRLRTAYELADLLDYLDRSPLGSVIIPDFKEIHFLLKDDKLKLIDMDDASSAESACAQASPNLNRTCLFGIQCEAGICPGQNAKHNLKAMHQTFFKVLLSSYPPEHSRTISEIRYKLDKLNISAKELKSVLEGMSDGKS